jgi:branched-chain amino acid transport system permease protein
MIDTLLQQIVNGLSVGMAYALIALGLTLIFGVLHVINFAHGELYMLGGLAAAVAVNALSLPYAAGLGAAVAAAAAAGWLAERVAVGGLVVRRGGLSDVLLSTYAVSLLLYHAALYVRGPAPERIAGFEGAFDLGPVTLTAHRAFVFAAGMALVAGVVWLLRRTRFGKQMRAMAQNRYAAEAVGIDVASIGARTYVLGGAIAGLAGGLLVPVLQFTPLMGHNAVIKAFVVVVVGGMGSVTGAVVCGLGLGVLEAVTGLWLPEGVTTALVYTLLIVMLLARPQGLFGASAGARH